MEIMKGAAQNGDHEGKQIMKGDKAAAAAKSRMEIVKGDKGSETRRQRQPRAAQNGVKGAAQNGDHEGRQMKGDK